MLNQRIIDILKSFSKIDIRRFRDFLDSPFFNKSEKIKKVYEYLIRFHPDFKSKLLTKENLYKEIDTSTRYNNSTILNLLADLSYHAENYLMYINIEDKEVKSKDFLVDELFKRNLGKLIEINIEKVHSLLKNNSDIDADYYINKYKITTDELNHININKARSKNSIINSYIDKLTDRGKYLTCFFITEMIREYDDLLTLNKTFTIERNSNFVFRIFNEIDFQKVLKFLISNSKKEDLTIVFNIYYFLYMAFSRFENEKYYNSYKKLLIKNLNIFSLDEKRFHLGKLIRYCKNKSLDGKLSTKYDDEQLNLYKYILNNGYYQSSVTKYLPVELFRTILQLGLKLKEYKWTEEFIKNFKNKLHPERRNNMYYYSFAEFYFSKKLFVKAMKSFHKVQLNHFMLKIDLRNLMLKTYYELNEFESALSLIDSYKHFLNYDETLSNSQRKSNKNFINIVQNLILHKTVPDYTDRYDIDKARKGDLPFKNWLDEKILKLNDKCQ